MKKLMNVMLLLGAGAPLPAQFGADPCRPGTYDASACLFQSMGQNRGQELAMAMSMTTNRRREWAAIDAQYPPVIVDSRPGKRVAPRRLANQTPGDGAKQREAEAEALLSEFESGLRAWPHALLDLPPNHLATAYMLYVVRSYMVMRGLEDVTPELAREFYYRFRRANRSAEAAQLVANAAEAQAVYEALLIDSLSLDAKWRGARASGDRAGMGALQRRAEQNLQGLFGASTAEALRQMDSMETFDRSARRDNQAVWGERTALRFAATPVTASSAAPSLSRAAPAVWRQFDFRQNEEFEYLAQAIVGAESKKGTVRVGVRVGADGVVAVSIKASMGGDTLDQVVTHKLGEGLPPITSLPWAQGGLGRALASSLLMPRPDLTLEALTSGMEWNSPDGSVKIKTVALGPCGQGPRLTGHLVSTVVTQAAVTNPPLLSCVGLDAPLPIMQKIAWAGGSIEFKLTSRTPAASIPDVAGRPR